MDLVALVFGSALAVLLIGVAIYFALRQRQTLALLRHDTELSQADRRYLHRQVIRRWINSGLLVLLALMLVGGVILEASLRELHPDEPVADLGQKLPDNVRAALRILAGYWITTLLVFLAVMLVAVLDFMATARYGAQQRRQLQDDHRDALEAEVERMRRDRHGLNGGL